MMEPPWVKFPKAHPVSIAWRMGAGEDYIHTFHDWWRDHAANLDEAARLAYLRGWPMPAAWTHIAIEMVWPGLSADIDMIFEPDHPARARIFAQAEAAGLPSETEWWADFNAEHWKL